MVKLFFLLKWHMSFVKCHISWDTAPPERKNQPPQNLAFPSFCTFGGLGEKLRPLRYRCSKKFLERFETTPALVGQENTYRSHAYTAAFCVAVMVIFIGYFKTTSLYVQREVVQRRSYVRGFRILVGIGPGRRPGRLPIVGRVLFPACNIENIRLENQEAPEIRTIRKRRYNGQKTN